MAITLLVRSLLMLITNSSKSQHCDNLGIAQSSVSAVISIDLDEDKYNDHRRHCT